MDFIIKDFQIEDIPLIANQQNLLIQHHLKYDNEYYQISLNSEEEISCYLKKRINDDDFKIYVAENNNKLIGYVMGWITERPPIYEKRKVGYLSNIFVDEIFRNQHIGKLLYQKLEEWFKMNIVDFIEIKADLRNKDTVEAFRHFGFTDLSITFYKKILR